MKPMLLVGSVPEPRAGPRCAIARVTGREHRVGETALLVWTLPCRFVPLLGSKNFSVVVESLSEKLVETQRVLRCEGHCRAHTVGTKSLLNGNTSVLLKGWHADLKYSSEETNCSVRRVGSDQERKIQ